MKFTVLLLTHCMGNIAQKRLIEKRKSFVHPDDTPYLPFTPTSLPSSLSAFSPPSVSLSLPVCLVGLLEAGGKTCLACPSCICLVFVSIYLLCVCVSAPLYLPCGCVFRLGLPFLELGLCFSKCVVWWWWCVSVNVVLPMWGCISVYVLWVVGLC